MKITIKEIKRIIKEELNQFVQKQKDLCRDEYVKCGDTVPCFEKFTQCEKDAAFQGVKNFRLDRSKKQKNQEKIAKGIYDLYKFIDEKGGRVMAFDIPDELYQFLSAAEKKGNITDTSDESESYGLGDPPEGYEETKLERENMKQLIKAVFDEDRVPDWAIQQKEDGSYYWQNYEENPPKTIIMPKHLEDLLNLD